MSQFMREVKNPNLNKSKINDNLIQFYGVIENKENS